MSDNFNIHSEDHEHGVGMNKMTDEINKCRKSTCWASARLSPKATKILKQYVFGNGIQNESAGRLKLEKEGDSSYIINCDKIIDGDAAEVSQIKTPYNWHSHPLSAYEQHNCDIGWPSRDDFVTFMDGFISYDTSFHLVASKEGVYVLKINPCIIKKLAEFGDKITDKDKFIDKFDQWCDDHINISKQDVQINRGVPKYKMPKHQKSGSIKSIDDYLNFIRRVKCNEINCGKSSLQLKKPPFDIELIPWSVLENGTYAFKFSNKKDIGKCSISGG